MSNAIATPQRLGRNHLPAVDARDGRTPQRVRGVISKAQIERQLGAALNAFERESSFAEFVQRTP